MSVAQTVVRFTSTHAEVELPNGVVITVTDDGDVAFTNGVDRYVYAPSRLKKNNTTVFQGDESSGTQRFAVDGNTTLSLKSERSGRLSVELFFHETTQEGVAVSGCYVTKYSDWGISFVDRDRFVVHLDKLFTPTEREE